MKRRARLGNRGTAAVEMALTLPLLLAIMFGSVELGNYFMNQHILVKAVREGARYAARQNIHDFTTCTGAPPAAIVNGTRAIVRTSVLSGGSDRLLNWNDANITLTINCQTHLDSGATVATGGFYGGVRNAAGANVGAPVITVSASVAYQPVLGSFGFTGVGYTLNAQQSAAVIGW